MLNFVLYTKGESMNKIIGGLLVLSMLSRPGIIKVDYFAYEIYKSNASIINYLKRTEAPVLNYDKEEIDMIMTEIDNNKRQITELVELKNDSLKQMDSILKEKSVKKVLLTSEQMEKFAAFSKFYSTRSENVREKMDYVSSDDLNDIQQQVLHNDINYRYIYEKFEGIAKNQNEIIDYLTVIINEANDTIDALA